MGTDPVMEHLRPLLGRAPEEEHGLRLVRRVVHRLVRVYHVGQDRGEMGALHSACEPAQSADSMLK